MRLDPRTLRFFADNRIYLIFAVTFVVFLVFVPDLRSVPALKNLLVRASIDGLMAVGVTVVILSGQLDLSVGAILALAGVVAIGLQDPLGPYLAAVAGIAAGGLVGALNGFLVVKAGVNSFIVTLATMIGIRGVAMTLTGAAPIRGLDPFFGASVDRAIFGPLWEQLGTFITPRIVIFLGVILASHYVLTRVRQGRNVYAVGGNTEAARLSGINVGGYQFGAFVFSGLTAGLAGTILALSLNTGSPIVGSFSVLPVIAAVVIGGTSLTGGSGSMLKTLMGVLLLALIKTGMNLAGLEIYVQNLVLGLILVIVVLIDAVYTSWRSRLVTATQLGSTRAA
jgi:ribose/xylose/arabinose/galactoside ABC-type transport system permease subunit